jgi:hypothetical protein
VLGPNTHEPDTVRLASLLHYAIQKNHRRPEAADAAAGTPTDRVFNMKVQPLYAEDFIGLVQRYDLENPYRFAAGR